MNTQNFDYSGSIVSWFRDADVSFKATSWTVIVTLLTLLLAPTVEAAQEAAEKQQNKAQVQDVQGDPLNDTLKNVDKSLKKAKDKLNKGQQIAEEKQQLRDLRKQLKAIDNDILNDFDKDLVHIEKHGLSDVIMERHKKAVEQYQQKMAEMLAHLDDIDAEKKSPKDKVDKTIQWLEKHISKPRHHPFDPENMPFSVPDNKVREPKTTKEEFAALFPAEKTMVASAGSLGGLGIMAATALATTPTPEDLAPTEDVQITQAIIDKAAELHHSPVEIYNWVHNNIEFIPTYGSIQGSDMTLQSLRGNAFDTASLLIALLRASNIPARYVYGTVEMPADKVMNWVGGVEVPEAASQLLGQGGIPHIMLTSAGKVVAFRMEHIWVDAFVDFYPSRGVKNIAPDSWVPMDASFKQYTYTKGMNLQEEVPFAAESFLESAQEGATINEDEGWVQNLNQQNIQSNLTQYQEQIEAFIEQQDENATVGDVIGSRTIVQSERPILATGLPYKKLLTGNTYASLPSGLHHKFSYTLYTDYRQRSYESYIFRFETNTVELAGKKVTFVFVPSTEDDRKAIESYLPEPHDDGTPVQPEEFPNSLPAYNIRVTPELRIEGEVVARGGSFTLGTELLGEGGFTQMNLNGWDLTTDPHVVGQSSALGISMQGISSYQLEKLRRRLANTEGKLDADDFEGLTGELMSGDLLAATVLTYFSAVEGYGRIAQQRAGMVDNPGLSYGFFHAMAVPVTLYGTVVNKIKFPGVLMDVGHLRRLAYAKDNNRDEWIGYNRTRGIQASFMESVIPELLLVEEDATVESISAAKALAIAVSGGQKIYTITKENQGELANIHQSQSVMDEISNAISIGKEVTIHQSPISHKGFYGAGYIITELNTGAGAYLIQGGGRGGIMLAGLSYLIGVLSFFYNALDAVSAGLGSKVPGLSSVARMLHLANFLVNILKTGLDCILGIVGPVLFVMTMFSLVSLLIVDLIGDLFNPIAGFAAGVAFDLGAGWLIGQAQNCK